MSKTNPWKRILQTLLIIGAVIIGGLWIIGTLFEVTEPAAALPAPTPFVVDSQIVAIGAKVGLTADQLAKAHAQVGTCPPKAAACHYSNVRSTIYIPADQISNPRVATNLAHEFYHHVYSFELTAENRAVLGDSLLDTYNEASTVGKQLRWRMQPYIESGLSPTSEEFKNELHSVFCTEVADNRMTPESLAYCSKWVPGRNGLENSIY
jgi:hypothetical protein